MAIRIIPRLDVKGPNLVKGIHLEGLRALGPIEIFARHYYHHGADELLYIDSVASLYGRNSLNDIIRRTSKEIFIPLTVGGGIRTLGDIAQALRAGADKVAINTAALMRPALINKAVQQFGSSTIIGSIQAARQPNGRYRCFTDSGREATNRDAVDWAKEMAERGVGEILITSIDKEGTGKSFDIEIVKMISQNVSIPVIAGGGAGGTQHVEQVIAEGQADAVSIASLFHFEVLENVEIAPESEIGIGHSAEMNTRTNCLPGISIPTLKSFLVEKGIEIRHEKQATLLSS